MHCGHDSNNWTLAAVGLRVGLLYDSKHRGNTALIYQLHAAGRWSV